jgi:hypothetical protein
MDVRIYGLWTSVEATAAIFQRYIHPSNTAIHKPLEIEHVRNMLLQLLQTPESFSDHIKQ